MKHWRMEDVAWDQFDPSKVKADLIPLMKAAALVERNAADYGIYLGRVFPDDPEFRAAIDRWTIEEVQHGEALGRWGTLADPGWDFEDAFKRFREGYQVPLDVDASVRGSRTGELIARCIVETGTSSYYTALAQTTEEPVMASICKLIAADEYRHFKLFYEHMRRYLDREQISFLKRLRIAAGRIGESEDDEMAYAYHCANKGVDAVYDHRQCIAVYMSTTVPIYRFGHVERVMGMVFKAVGLKPRGRLSDVSARVAWHLLQRRGRKMAEIVTPDVELPRAA
jgi:rubrerythrin